MKGAGQFHDFFAPIDGVSRRFTMRCGATGAPNWLACMEPLPLGEKSRVLFGVLEDCNGLLTSGLPWAALTIHKAGDIGAVIEAAENRRAEIYGPSGGAFCVEAGP